LWGAPHGHGQRVVLRLDLRVIGGRLGGEKGNFASSAGMFAWGENSVHVKACVQIFHISCRVYGQVFKMQRV
jgi:hypothetical protein